MSSQQFLVVACVLAGATAAIGGPPENAKEGHVSIAAATVANRVAEADLTSVRLSPEAEKRLGIQTATVEQRKVVRTRTLPGEVLAPHGRSVNLMAPVAAYVLSGKDGEGWPQEGMRIKANEPILRLATGGATDARAISAGDRISLAKAQADLTGASAEIRGEVTQAEVRVEAANVKLHRADLLLRDKVASQRAYDEAKAEHDLAQTALGAAKARLEVVTRILKELESDQESSLPIISPFDGILRFIHVVPGQIVPAGAALVDVYSLDPVWVRVPVYIGELNELDTSGDARIRSLAGRPGDPAMKARRVTTPVSANPLAASVDLFFELANPDLTLTPGQRVGVVLPTKASANSLVVPHAAILYDFSGGAWVYENPSPQTFVRRRVEVSDVVGDVASLVRGPAVGAKIVTDGAAELFGTEFGAGK